jgi:hypothetical protein
MATLTLRPAPAAPSILRPQRRTAVLTAGCDGYRAGTTGEVLGIHDGCIVFAPDAPEQVARWARPRTTLLVPPSFVVSVP